MQLLPKFRRNSLPRNLDNSTGIGLDVRRLDITNTFRNRASCPRADRNSELGNMETPLPQKVIEYKMQDICHVFVQHQTSRDHRHRSKYHLL